MNGFVKVVFICLISSSSVLGRKFLKKVTGLPQVGKSCGSGEFTVCHADVAETIAGITGYAKVCNDGEVELMKVPVDYISPRKQFKVCSWEGRYICHNDEVSDESGQFPISRTCVDGTVKVINTITGLSL